MVKWATRRLTRPVVPALLVFGVICVLLYLSSQGSGRRDVDVGGGEGVQGDGSAQPPPATSGDDNQASPPLQQQEPLQPLQPLPPPREYLSTRDPLDPYCASRFSTPYFEDMRNHIASYCAPEATSRLTCLHSHTRGQADAIDSLCVGQGIKFERRLRRFALHCPLRQLGGNEIKAGLIPWDGIKDYWYETGVHEVFHRAVAFVPQLPQKRAEPEVSGSEDITPPAGDQLADAQGDTTPPPPPPPPPSTFILLKREGEGNLWHCMMEIFSLYMSLDVLSMTRDLERTSEPYFNLTSEPPDTQVIITDEREDGPYFDLWTLFAGRKPLRLHELADDVATTERIADAKIIIPLTGSSNPLWQDDEAIWKCSNTPTLSVFADRVIGFYNIPDPVPRTKDDPIRVTFIDRQGRKLRDQDELFAELGRRYKHISIRLVDFATISFREQIAVARETDILVGVHGAGLTHTMFMRYGAGAMVEIQPAVLRQWGYRNLAYMRDLNYFRIHAQPNPPEGEQEQQQNTKREWHFEDVDVDKDMFFIVMEAAIKSMYTVFPWDLDASQ